MKYRFWNLDKDYTILEGWCKERNWESNIPKEMLPPQGIIVEDEDTICALGLYLNEQVKFGYMYGIFSNPKIGKMKLYRAMKLCVDEIKKQAIKNKLGLVYTTTGESPLNKLYTKHMDMELCEKSVKSYVINLNKKKYKNLDWIS